MRVDAEGNFNAHHLAAKVAAGVTSEDGTYCLETHTAGHRVLKE